MENTLKALWRQPVFASILERRRETAVLVGVGIVHLGLNLAGYSFWNCPILAATGVPCPGCGLTRAVMQLLHGDLSAAMRTHAFAPLVLAALFLMILVPLLPEAPRARLIGWVRTLETRNGLTAWVFLSLMFYWAARLIL